MKAREVAERLMEDPEAHVMVIAGVDDRGNVIYREVVSVIPNLLARPDDSGGGMVQRSQNWEDGEFPAIELTISGE